MCVCLCVGDPRGAPLFLTALPSTPSSPKQQPQELRPGRLGVKRRTHLGRCGWLSAMSLWLSFTCCLAQTSLPRRLGRGQAWLCWDPETRARSVGLALEGLEVGEWRGWVGSEIPGTWCCEEADYGVPWLAPLAHPRHMPEGGEFGVVGQGQQAWVGLESAQGPHSPSPSASFGPIAQPFPALGRGGAPACRIRILWGPELALLLVSYVSFPPSFSL